MIKWKQRLYALLLRQVVGPLLDSESQEKLHESIDVSFQEGTFVLSNVCLCTTYLNKFDVGPLFVKKARVGSLAIRLSLVEGQAPESGTCSSIAWRAMNLGSSVALVAQIEIDGLQLELEPRKKTAGAISTSENSFDNSHSNINGSDSDTETAVTQPKSTLSSYIDAALSSLQLTLNMTNCCVRLSQPNNGDSHGTTPSTTSWIELCLPSLTYQDVDTAEKSQQQQTTITSSTANNSTSKKILQKSVTWQGISLVAGECKVTQDGTVTSQDPNLTTTMALAEGTGQILLRAVEFLSDDNSKEKNGRVQQDVDVRLNQQIKVSLDETSLRQVQSVVDGFATDASPQNEEADALQLQESVESDMSQTGTMMEETELYTISGIMKQYQEARMLAARNEMRGGILLPSNAFEEQSDEADSRSFDMFFDANDKSFSHYASMMKESMLASRDGGPSDSFVHTKIRLHVLGVAVKLVFRDRTDQAAPYLGPEEYILLNFDELNATSSISHKHSEVAFHISHLEIDDSQIPEQIDAAECRKAEIGTLLCFTQSDNIVHPACISFHLETDTQASGCKVHNVELNLMPIELVLRQKTASNLTGLISSLENNNNNKGDQSEGIKMDSDNQHVDADHALAPATNPTALSALCTISSLTVTIPAVNEHDFSSLYARCGDSCSGSSNLTSSAIGFVIEEITLEHKLGDTTNEESKASCSTLECQSLLVFASSPDIPGVPMGRSKRLDIFAATGRFEVEPHIPIVMQYQATNGKEATERASVARAMFPTVPPFSSFKARQEDEDEDAEVDHILSKQLRNVDVNSRQTLRAKDPQSEMIAEAEKAAALVKLHVPELVCDLSREELHTLQDLLSCCLPPTSDVKSSGDDGDSGMAPTSSVPSIAISAACDSISCSLVDRYTNHGVTQWGSQLIRLDRCRAHGSTGDGTAHCLRMLAHETTFYELVARLPSWAQSHTAGSIADRVTSLRFRATTTPGASTEPIVYRSRVFPAISPSSPSLLVDFVRNNGACEGVDQSIFISVYNITHRFNPESRWLDNLQHFVSAVDSATGKNHEGVEHTSTMSCETSSLTKIFASLADCNVDYTSLRKFSTESRSILRVGDLRFSSNILIPEASVQAYNLSLGDLSWQLCNTRCSYNDENSLLPGAALIMPPKHLYFDQQQPTRAHPPNLADYTFRMGFKTLVTLDSVRAVIVKRNAKCYGSVDSSKETAPTEPPLTTSLALGEVSLYACQDSFNCFADSIGDLETMLTSLSNEELRELQTSSKRDLVSEGKQEPQVGKAQTVAVDVGSSFLLDGYDWTTIDHDGRSATPILPGEEQSARWYHAPTPMPTAASTFSPQSSIVEVTHSEINRVDASVASSVNESYAPKIIDHHFPLQVIDIQAAQHAGSKALVVTGRVLLHDMKVKIRLFDGYDWPQYQRRKKLDPSALFVIEEPQAEKAEKTCSTAESGAGSQGRTATKHLEGLLGGPSPVTDTFADMPLPEERAVSLLTQNEIRLFSRRTNSYIQISADGVTARIDSYQKSTQHRLKSSLQCSLKDFFLAETISNAVPVKMMGEWFNETEHPRDSRDGLLMLKMLTCDPKSPVTDDGRIASEESEVVVTMAPARCIIDQRAVKFLKAFFGDPDDDSDDEEEAEADTKKPEWAADLHPIPPPFLRSFRMNPVKLKIDYSPQKVDTAALKNGSVVELINLSPLDAMVLTLAQVEITNVVGFGDAIGGLVSSWLGDICATQMHKFLANARPFEPITNVGGGVADLFVLPWDAYQNGDSVPRALRSSMSSLVGTVAHETLTQSSRFTGFIADEVGKATSSPQSAGSKSHSTLPSRPLRTPRRVGDTTRHAFESLASGLQTANYKVIVVPYREYRRGSAAGVVKSIVKGIPVAVAAPVGGVSESISYALLGLRNQVRPDLRKEEEATKRGLHYGGV